VVEVDGAAKAVADLVGDTHQQQAGDEQVRLLEMAQVGQPDEKVEVQEEQAEIEPAGPAVPGAQRPPAQRRVADVEAERSASCGRSAARRGARPAGRR
jgi:hypothetical protein